MTVNQLIDYLNECRDRGMGEAKIITADDEDNYTPAICVATQSFTEDEDGYLHLVDGVTKGKEAVLIW